MDPGNKSSESQQTSQDEEIQNRLQRLKENRETAGTSNKEIQNRLQKIKGDIPKTNDAELQERLARLRGLPVSVFQSQVYILKKNLKHKLQMSLYQTHLLKYSMFLQFTSQPYAQYLDSPRVLCKFKCMGRLKCSIHIESYNKSTDVTNKP